MQRRLNGLVGYAVHANDGNIGHVKEFYFDDAQWVMRYLVVDIGRWLPGRKILIAPQALQAPDWEKKLFPVNLTKEQIRTSPDIDTDKPIARQHEVELHRHYGWEMYLAAEALIGTSGALDSFRGVQVDVNKGGKRFDHHLRTTRVITGLHIQAKDGRVGHVTDFLADDRTWVIEQLVVDTHDWLPGRKVLIQPQWVSAINIEDRVLSVGVTRQQVKDSLASETCRDR